MITEDQKETINLHLSVLKMAMKEEGLIFGIVVDKSDFDNSSLAFVSKESVAKGKIEGMNISLTDLNRGLV